MNDVLAVLETYYDTAPRAAATAEEHGPFTVFVRTRADGWPYYSETGDILPGVDHPFEFPDEARKIPGGEITEY